MGSHKGKRLAHTPKLGPQFDNLPTLSKMRLEWCSRDNHKEIDMSVPADQTYPATATDPAWQKKKSFIDKAKASTKTGLGADLKAAELKWKAIPWNVLDAKKLAAKSAEAAQKQLDTAKAAGAVIQEAKTALAKARATAQATATNKALSKPAQAAATSIANALQSAATRLNSIKTLDFEDALKTLASNELIKINKIRVLLAGNEIATGGSATWDRKILKVTGVAWKVGTGNDHKGKSVTVRGETDGSSMHAEGISKVFANDMKVDTVSGNTATFKP